VSDFREHLLRIMDRKDHWAWPAFSHGRVDNAKLHVHLEQEFATYVRDFPVFVGRAYVQCPVSEVRRELAENLYEEETGGLVAGKPHPELFLDYPRGLGMDLARFAHITLLPAAQAYRALVDALTTSRGWEVATCVVTIFIEGSANERAELDPAHPRTKRDPAEHPLVKYYGLPPSHLRLSRAHDAVEGSHRDAAWRIVTTHIAPAAQPLVIAAMEEVLGAWLRYRDEVAAACGLKQ
jgi:pyrroloquinoline-quinone synthase